MFNPVVQIQSLRREFKAQYKGHRARIVSLTCRSFKLALEIQKSSSRRKSFFAIAKIPSKGRKKLNIATEVLNFAMSGDRSEKKRKLAWKRSRAVQYLYSNGTPINELEREIVKRGGIEALVREAAKESPRGGARGSPSRPSAWGKASTASLSPDDEEGLEVTRSLTNDQSSLVFFKISLSNLDRLRDLKVGKEAKLTVTRLANSSPIAEVRRLRPFE